MATMNQVRKAMHAQPFQPFTLHLADGRTFVVKHPDFIAVSPNGRETVFVGDDEGIHDIEMLMIVEVETPKARSQGAQPEDN